MVALAVDGAIATPVAHLFAAVSDAIGKLYPPSLEQFGLTPRDRVGPRSNSPLWDVATRVGKIFGAEYELFEHAGASPVITVEPFDPPAVIVSQGVRKLPLGQQVFLLAHAIGPIAMRLHAARSLTTAELESVLVGAVRVISPGFELPGTPGDESDDTKDTIRKHVPRRWKKPMELAATEIAAGGAADIAAWRTAYGRTVARAAMLVADDLAASIAALGYVAELPPAKGVALVQSSPEVRDLMHFWISSRAAAIRRQARIVS